MSGEREVRWAAERRREEERNALKSPDTSHRNPCDCHFGPWALKKQNKRKHRPDSGLRPQGGLVRSELNNAEKALSKHCGSAPGRYTSS